MLRPIRVPYRGPLPSTELVEFSQVLHQLLQAAQAPAFTEIVNSEIPTPPWPMILLRDRLKGKVKTA